MFSSFLGSSENTQDNKLEGLQEQIQQILTVQMNLLNASKADKEAIQELKNENAELKRMMAEQALLISALQTEVATLKNTEGVEAPSKEELTNKGYILHLPVNQESLLDIIPDNTSDISIFREKLFSLYESVLEETNIHIETLLTLGSDNNMISTLKPLLSLLNCLAFAIDILKNTKANTLKSKFEAIDTYLEQYGDGNLILTISRQLYDINTEQQKYDVAREQLKQFKVQKNDFNKIVLDLDSSSTTAHLIRDNKLRNKLKLLLSNQELKNNLDLIAFVEHLIIMEEKIQISKSQYELMKTYDENVTHIAVVCVEEESQADLMQSMIAKPEIKQDLSMLNESLQHTGMLIVMRNMVELQQSNLSSKAIFIKTMETTLWQFLIKLTNISSGLGEAYPKSYAESATKTITGYIANNVPFGGLIDIVVNMAVSLHYSREENKANNILLGYGVKNIQKLFTELPTVLANIWEVQINQLSQARLQASQRAKQHRGFFSKSKHNVLKASDKASELVFCTKTYPLEAQLAMCMSAVVAAFISESKNTMPNIIDHFDMKKTQLDIVRFMVYQDTNFKNKIKGFFNIGNINVNGVNWQLHEILNQCQINHTAGSSKYGPLTLEVSEIDYLTKPETTNKPRYRAAGVR